MSTLPHLGVGLGYRTPLHRDILRHVRELDFLEILSDGFFRNEKGLRALASIVPLVPHSLNLSLGTEPDADYLDAVKRVVAATDPPWHTDHLAYTKAGGVAVGHLVPVPYTEESLERVVRNVKRVQEATDVPFAVENITMPFYWPNNTIEEHDFLAELVRRTGCGILLDLENVRVNHENHGRGGKDFLDRLPLESVVQVHVAGGVAIDGLAHDSHSAPVSEATWSLLEHLAAHHVPAGVLIERDSDFPPFPELLGEVRRAKEILRKAGAA